MADQSADATRPLRADARRNREKVLHAARDAFAAAGFGVPLDEIAARAGVGPGTVYRHFPTKEALFEAVIQARIEDLVADARARSGAVDPGEAFFGFLARVGQEARVKRDLPDAIAVPGPLQDALYEAIGVLLSRAQHAGAVRGDVTTSELVVLFKAAAAAFQDASATPATRDQVFAVITDGLRSRSRGLFIQQPIAAPIIGQPVPNALLLSHTSRQ
jgi:AcrR family transcriptional regulator